MRSITRSCRTIVSPAAVADADDDRRGAHAVDGEVEEVCCARDAGVEFADRLLALPRQLRIIQVERSWTNCRRQCSIDGWFCAVGGTMTASLMMPPASMV